MGMGPEGTAVQGTSAPEGKFFFAPGTAGERAELLRQHLPDQAEAIGREAEAICQHRFGLLGYENLDYGAEIDWHLDRVHDKRAPLDPWFKIPFLDFAVVGDHKVTWELNRHQHLVTLAKAWLLTKDDKYLRELIAQWRSWDRGQSLSAWNQLGQHARSCVSQSVVDLGGPVARDNATACGVSRRAAARAGISRAIHRTLSVYLFFSQHSSARRSAGAVLHRNAVSANTAGGSLEGEGWKILRHEAGRQVRPDGVYFEQSLYYHVYALDFFLHARLLAAQNEMLFRGTMTHVVGEC